MPHCKCYKAPVTIRVDKAQPIPLPWLRRQILNRHEQIRRLGSIPQLSPDQQSDLRIEFGYLLDLIYKRLPDSRNYALSLNQDPLGKTQILLSNPHTSDSICLNELAPANTQILLGEHMRARPARLSGDCESPPKIWVNQIRFDFCGAALILLHEIGHLSSQGTIALDSAISAKRKTVSQFTERYRKLSCQRQAPDFTDYRCFFSLDEQQELYLLENLAENEAWEWALCQARRLEPRFNVLGEIGEEQDVALFVESSLLTYWLTQKRNLAQAPMG